MRTCICKSVQIYLKIYYRLLNVNLPLILSCATISTIFLLENHLHLLNTESTRIGKITSRINIFSNPKSFKRLSQIRLHEKLGIIQVFLLFYSPITKREFQGWQSKGWHPWLVGLMVYHSKHATRRMHQFNIVMIRYRVHKVLKL